MRAPCKVLIMIAASSALSCDSGADSTQPAVIEDISGTYAGPISALYQLFFVLEAELSLTLRQEHQSLAGTWSLEGAIYGPVLYEVTVQSGGSIQGSVGVGENPSVTLQLAPDTCPGFGGSLSGDHDRRTLTLAGNLSDLDEMCAVSAEGYLTSALLTRTPGAT